MSGFLLIEAGTFYFLSKNILLMYIVKEKERNSGMEKAFGSFVCSGKF
jgi:hypothetical protein